MSSLPSWTAELLGSALWSACGSCRPLVWARIAELPLASTLLALMAPLLALAAIAAALHLARRP